MHRFKKYLISLMLIAGCFSTLAQPITTDHIPPVLQDWQQWVVYDKPESACPFLYNNFAKRYCAWPTQLSVDIQDKRIYFTQNWQVYAPSLLALPGEALMWPQNVKVDGNYYPVINDNGIPKIELAQGSYRVVGFLPFSGSLPESIKIPAQTGLIQVNNQPKGFEHPRIDEAGRLWLHHQENNLLEPGLQIRVFRKITQSVPMEALTYIELDVSGPAREVQLGPVLLPESLAMRIDSPLPVQLEETGLLRVQVRPGTWQIEINSRFLGQMTTLKRGEVGPPWPAEEIWVFDRDPHLGWLTVEGVPSVDPSQTLMPDAWRNFPAYRVLVGDPVVLAQNNEALKVNNQLTLVRKMWLDFSGQLWTVHDALQGKMLEHWRLSLHEPFVLGRFTLDDKEQLITALEDAQGHLIPGVELRQGQLSASAMSLANHTWRLPVTGWNEHFNTVETTLFLPPGWQMFTVLGVDKLSGTWLSQWTLLDIFIVLLIAIALATVLGVKIGAAGLVMLILTYHQVGLPIFIWLNIVLVLWLMQWLRAYRGSFLLALYRDFSFLVLALGLVWLCSATLIASLYPQLHRQTPHLFAWEQTQPATVGLPLEAPTLMEASPMTRKLAVAPSAKDPFAVPIDAKTQTGPAEPQWQWTQVSLHWQTPVINDEHMYIMLISPLMQRILMVLQIFLSVLIGLRLWHMRKQPLKLHLPITRSALIVPLCVMILGHLPTAEANDIPDPALLETLQTRLLAPPQCMPHCASLTQAVVHVNADELHLVVQVDAAADVAVPIPGRAAYWQPEEILVDNMPARGLFWQDNTLMVQLEAGMHTIAIKGTLADIDKLSLEFLLPLHWLDVETQGWFVEGIVDHQLLGNSLQLVRKERQIAQGVASVAPFVRVVRTLNLGLEGTVSTRVERIAPAMGAIQLAIPLLPHESVVSAMRVQNNRAQVYLNADQREVSWQSTLSNFNDLTLLAPQTAEWVEEWEVLIAPVWHPTITGIPALQQENDTVWESRWKPWPLQSVHIQLVRPQAMAGQTTTIEEVNLLTKAHPRGQEVSMQAMLRSTVGESQTLILPQDARITQVRVNGVAQLQAGGSNTLILPLSPGNNHLDIAWQRDEKLGMLTRTPIIDWGMPAYNITLGLDLPADRFVIALGGSGYGPAVLYGLWVIGAVILAIILGKVIHTPLAIGQWMGLTVGLSLVTPMLGLWVVIAIVLLSVREKLTQACNRHLAKGIPIVLYGFVLVAVLVLFYAIIQGLHGVPHMQFVASALNTSMQADYVWIQDLAMKVWPRAWIISLPLWVYRLVMLVWALWIILLLLRLGPWVWRTLRGK